MPSFGKGFFNSILAPFHVSYPAEKKKHHVFSGSRLLLEFKVLQNFNLKNKGFFFLFDRMSEQRDWRRKQKRRFLSIFLFWATEFGELFFVVAA